MLCKSLLSVLLALQSASAHEDTHVAVTSDDSLDEKSGQLNLTQWMKKDDPKRTTTTSTTTVDPCSSIELFILMIKDTIGCPDGYDIINTTEDCVKGAQYLNIAPSDTNGDKKNIDLSNTSAMLAWVRQREICSTCSLGSRMPYGCFADQSIRVVAESRKLVTTLWVNLNQNASGKHDNSSPICKSKSSCGAPPDTVWSPPALYAAGDKVEGEQLRKGNGLAAESPVRILINGVVSLMLMAALVFVVRRQQRHKDEAASYSGLAVQDEDSHMFCDAENPADPSQFVQTSLLPVPRRLLGLGNDEQTLE